MVDDADDVRSLTCVSRFFASIACPIYVTKLGIDVTASPSFVRIHGASFQALAIWRRSRLFHHVQDKHLFCDFNTSNLQIARQQARALQRFLSTPFIGRPFMSICISSAGALPPPEILQFIQLIDGAGCRAASISSGVWHPGWLDIVAKSCSLKLTTVTIHHLSGLDIDNRLFSPRQWSNLLRHLTAPPLQTLRIAGRPSTRSLNKFLSRHSHITRLCLQPHGMGYDRSPLATECLPKCQMPNLVEIEGPPRHLHMVLGYILPTSPVLTMKVNWDGLMAYPQYVRAVLYAVSRCKTPIHLKMSLASDCDLLLDQKGVEFSSTIPLPEVISLEITFLSKGENQDQVLVCVLLLCFLLLHRSILQDCCAHWFSIVPKLRHIGVYVQGPGPQTW